MQKEIAIIPNSYDLGDLWKIKKYCLENGITIADVNEILEEAKENNIQDQVALGLLALMVKIIPVEPSQN